MTPFDLIDSLVMSNRYRPYFGWHDDHRHYDGTSEYRPALQQVKAEFRDFIGVCTKKGVNKNCLQLGIGEIDASHDAWNRVFYSNVSIDWRKCVRSSATVSIEMSGHDTADPEAVLFAQVNAPYDLLFLDAGHSYDEVKRDFTHYRPFVSSGGIIAFHDAVKRPGFEEIEVWRFLSELEGLTYIGEEVGIAWMVKP